MRVVHLNKSDCRGGAAIAASRLVEALRGANIEASMLVAQKSGDRQWVHQLVKSHADKIKLNFNFILDLVHFLPHERNASVRFAFSMAKSGFDISKHPLISNADIIHLHWFNQGFLSLKGMRSLFELGKPVVWTLHDMWAFTGGCHYAGDCKGYTLGCGGCPFTRFPGSNDPSARQHLRKRAIYQHAPLNFVTCSEWLAGLARSSSLVSDNFITSIPNPIDIEFFKPISRDMARQNLGLSSQKRVILFGAANVNDPRKGMDYLASALQKLATKCKTEEVEILVFGKASGQYTGKLPFSVKQMEYVSNPETLLNIYNAADIFVLPSLEDNLPNTVMESLACGTPVVAFNIGGVPELVDHGLNGFLAKPRDVNDLSEGIESILLMQDANIFRVNARQKVLDKFNPQLVSGKYIRLYESILREHSSRASK